MNTIFEYAGNAIFCICKSCRDAAAVIWRLMSIIRLRNYIYSFSHDFWVVGELFKNRDRGSSRSGYLVLVREAPEALPDWESWGDTAAVRSDRQHYWMFCFCHRLNPFSTKKGFKVEATSIAYFTPWEFYITSERGKNKEGRWFVVVRSKWGLPERDIGYIPVRHVPGTLPDCESCWDAAAVIWRLMSIFWLRNYIYSCSYDFWVIHLYINLEKCVFQDHLEFDEHLSIKTNCLPKL